MSRANPTGEDAVIGIHIVNGKLVRQGIENFVKSIPDIGRLRIYKVMKRIYNRLGVYAPTRAVADPTGRSKRGHAHAYVRTYNLRNSRQLIKLDDGYLVVNDPVSPWGSHYAVYVRGDMGGGGQTPQNKEWELLANIVDQELVGLPEDVLKALAVSVAVEAEKSNVA